MRPDGLFIEIAGSAHLFGGEAALLEDLVSRLDGRGIAVRAAVADTPGAAWAMARCGGEAIAPPGGTAAALAGLPVGALRIPDATAASLDRLGIRTIGEAAALPRASLIRRFGAEFARRLDQALGERPEPLVPLIPPEVITRRAVFAEPIGDADDLRRVIAHLTAELCPDLRQAGLGARRVDLLFHRVDRTTQALTAQMARATREPAHIGRLLADDLDTLDPGFGIEEAVMVATRVEPLSEQQMQARALQGEDEERELDALVDRLTARLGRDRVFRVVPVESDIPERSLARVPPLTPPQGLSWPKGLARPGILIDPPEPVTALAVAPDHAPSVFDGGRSDTACAVPTARSGCTANGGPHPPRPLRCATTTRSRTRTAGASGSSATVPRARADAGGCTGSSGERTHPLGAGCGGVGSPGDLRCPVRTGAGAMSYAELQVTTHFSFLRGASSPEELFATAALLGMPSLGVADRNSLAGIVRAHEAARATGVRLVVGCRLDLEDGTALLVYPQDRAAYGRLTRLLTVGKARAGKGACRLSWDDVRNGAKASSRSSCRPHRRTASEPGAAPEDHVRDVRVSRARPALPPARGLAPPCARRDRPCRAGADRGHERRALSRARAAHAPGRRDLHPRGLHHRDGGFPRERFADRFLKAPEEMARLFERHPAAIERTIEIAERCRFSLSELEYQYPDEVVEPGLSAQGTLERLTREGAERRFPGGVPEPVQEQLRHEPRPRGEDELRAVLPHRELPSCASRGAGRSCARAAARRRTPRSATCSASRP
jgi:protein ImuB